MMTNEHLDKMRACVALLPSPGDEVARELIREIDLLRAENAGMVAVRGERDLALEFLTTMGYVRCTDKTVCCCGLWHLIPQPG